MSEDEDVGVAGDGDARAVVRGGGVFFDRGERGRGEGRGERGGGHAGGGRGGRFLGVGGNPRGGWRGVEARTDAPARRGAWGASAKIRSKRCTRPPSAMTARVERPSRHLAAR